MKTRLVTVLALIVLILVFLVATFAYLGVIEAPFARIAGSLGLVRSSRVASSQLILQQLRDVLKFHAVEYVYRTVFPHDFYPEGVSLTQVLNRLAVDNRPVEDVLSNAERTLWEAYNLANDVGLRASRDEFVVVTVRTRGGFDLEGTAFDPESPRRRRGGETVEPAFRVVEDVNAEGRTVHVLTMGLPEPEVVDIVVEDVDPERYRYPEVGLDPAGWQRVAEFVSARVVERTIDDGILDRTRENTEAFLRSLFLQAGFDRVEFF